MKFFDPRNPLGIISLLISLIYGITALLLGTSINHISAFNQNVLVWFIVAFPAAVLASLMFLVVKHYGKLYGPGEYRSDQSFLQAGTDPSLVGQKYVEQAEAEVAALDYVETQEQLTSTTPTEPSADSQADVAARAPLRGESHMSASQQTVLRTLNNYMIEGLVMQDLQISMNASVRRDVSVTANGFSVTLDGVVECEDSLIVVEVRFLGSTTEAVRRIRDSVETLKRGVSALSATADNVSGLLAIVIDDDIGPFQRGAIHRTLDELKRVGLEYRTYSSAALIERFGLPKWEMGTIRYS